RGRSREATPNVAYLFPRTPKTEPAVELAQAIERYNDAELRLVRPKTLDATRLGAHWRRLRKLRIRLERLAWSGQLERAPEALRRQVGRLLDRPVSVSVVGDGPSEELLRDAADRRLGELVAMARLANAWLGFHFREVLGVPIETGES